MNKSSIGAELKNLKIGLIRRGPLDPTGEVVISGFLPYLQDRLNMEEVICGWDKQCGEIDPKRLASSRVVTYHNKYLRDRQLHSRMPRYDLYHFHYPLLTSLVRYRRPAVVTVYDLIPLRFPHLYSPTRRKLTKKRLIYSSKADRIITACRSTKEDLVQLLKIDPEKIKVIYLGVNHQIYTRRDKDWARRTLGLPRDKRILLNIGTESPNKNIESLIRVFYRLTKKFEDLILLRVGWSTSDAVTQLINKLKIGHKVLKKVALSQHPNLYYNAADLYICPEILGGGSLPHLEAMASGCPVISSDAGSYPEVVGEAGLFFNPWDEDDIFEKTAILLEDSKLREEYVQKGLERAKLFSWEKTAEEIIKVYTQVVGEYY